MFRPSLNHLATGAVERAVGETVRAVRPDEASLVGASLAVRSRDGRLVLSPPRTVGSGVGVGVESLTLAQMLIEVGIQALAQAGGLAVVSGGVWAWRRRRQARTDLAPAAVEWPESLRSAVRQHAQVFDLDPAVTELLADALVGATEHPTPREDR
ncbi:MAG: hypothetical protein ACRCYU_13865 [Nocardioides sp.]